MSSLINPIKLNPTTITIPRSLPSASYALKLGLIPHLLIQDTLTSSSGVRGNGDAIFEVTVPVGGMIELEVEVDREGLARVGGMDMSLIQEIELEDMIKQIIMNSFRRNTAQLAIQEIRPHSDKTSFIIRPLASSADRSSASAALIPSYQPIAYLDKIGVCINWCLPANREKDSDESQSSNTDSLPSTHGDDIGIEEESGTMVPGGAPNGQLPVWANTQLQQGLDQLFRTNLIKRFPLLFDPDLPQYIPSFTKSSTLLHTLTRALALSASHRTKLYLAARPILHSLLQEQDRMEKYKIEQISNLSRRGKAKRAKGDPTLEPPESQISPEPESQGVSTREVSKEINVRLLSDAISRMGYSEYKSRRTRGGKLGYRSIKLSLGDTETLDQVVSSQELNQKMHHLHLNDEGRFDAFLESDDEDDHQYPMERRYDDDFFLDSDLEDEPFLESDGDDDFLDTDEEDGRMEGGDVLGYPWPDQMHDEGDDWLDGVDGSYHVDRHEDQGHSDVHHHLNGHDEFLDFNHEPTNPPSQENRVIGEYTTIHPFGHDHLVIDDGLLDSEDDPPPHQMIPSPSPEHHRTQMNISLDDVFLYEEDDIEDLENQVQTSQYHPPSPQPLLHLSLPCPGACCPTRYIRPRSPQFSLGQAGAMIAQQIENHEYQEFLDSDDNECESEMGVYTADQYSPDPAESEMGDYTADQEFLNSQREAASELGEYTADQLPSHAIDEPESEMGVYTVDQYFQSSQTSLLSSAQSIIAQEGFLDDDEEVVYQIPSMPDIDMRHYQYPPEDFDDDFLMSEGDAMSNRSDLPITPPHDRNPSQRLLLDGDHADGMDLDCSQGRSAFETGGQSLLNVLPFNLAETDDEAMPASQDLIESDDDLF